MESIDKKYNDLRIEFYSRFRITDRMKELMKDVNIYSTERNQVQDQKFYSDLVGFLRAKASATLNGPQLNKFIQYVIQQKNVSPEGYVINAIINYDEFMKIYIEETNSSTSVYTRKIERFIQWGYYVLFICLIIGIICITIGIQSSSPPSILSSIKSLKRNIWN